MSVECPCKFLAIRTPPNGLNCNNYFPFSTLCLVWGWSIKIMRSYAHHFMLHHIISLSTLPRDGTLLVGEL